MSLCSFVDRTLKGAQVKSGVNSQQSLIVAPQHPRTGTGYITKLSCHAPCKYKRNKTSEQMHHHVSGGLQSEKIFEMRTKKNNGSSNSKKERD